MTAALQTLPPSGDSVQHVPRQHIVLSRPEDSRAVTVAYVSYTELSGEVSNEKPPKKRRRLSKGLGLRARLEPKISTLKRSQMKGGYSLTLFASVVFTQLHPGLQVAGSLHVEGVYRHLAVVKYVEVLGGDFLPQRWWSQLSAVLLKQGKVDRFKS